VFSQPGLPKTPSNIFNRCPWLVAGYHATLEDSRVGVLVQRMQEVDIELRGFAFEGVGMGLAALDCLTPWKNRVNEFAEGRSPLHLSILCRCRLALARMRRNPEPYLKRLDPVLNWVILDGYGFHEGFFPISRQSKTTKSQKNFLPMDINL